MTSRPNLRLSFTRCLNTGLSSGAPPVISTHFTEGDFLTISKQRSAISKLICSVRLGDDSTWQWLHAWLQYKPMFIWKMDVGSRVRAQLCCSVTNSQNDGTLVADRERRRFFLSSNVNFFCPFVFRSLSVEASVGSLSISCSVSSINEVRVERQRLAAVHCLEAATKLLIIISTSHRFYNDVASGGQSTAAIIPWDFLSAGNPRHRSLTKKKARTYL